MGDIVKLPERTGYDDFIDEGFEPELAAIASVLCQEIDELKERLSKLEETS